MRSDLKTSNQARFDEKETENFKWWVDSRSICRIFPVRCMTHMATHKQTHMKARETKMPTE